MFKRQRMYVHVPDRRTIEISATALHTWSKKKPPDLKLLMMILGSNGLLHNAQVYEKCLRAHVDNRKSGKQAFMNMTVKRFDGVKAPVLSGGVEISVTSRLSAMTI